MLGYLSWDLTQPPITVVPWHLISPLPRPQVAVYVSPDFNTHEYRVRLVCDSTSVPGQYHRWNVKLRTHDAVELSKSIGPDPYRAAYTGLFIKRRSSSYASDSVSRSTCLRVHRQPRFGVVRETEARQRIPQTSRHARASHLLQHKRLPLSILPLQGDPRTSECSATHRAPQVIPTEYMEVKQCIVKVQSSSEVYRPCRARVERKWRAKAINNILIVALLRRGQRVGGRRPSCAITQDRSGSCLARNTCVLGQTLITFEGD